MWGVWLVAHPLCREDHDQAGLAKWESGLARTKAANSDASKIGQIKRKSQVGWLEMASSVETEANRSLPVMLKRVPDNCHRVGMWAPRHQSFPFSKRSKAFGIFKM